MIAALEVALDLGRKWLPIPATENLEPFPSQ
jgi:hypothetical protein